MRKIGVHLNEEIGAEIERLSKARTIRRTQALLFRPVQDVNATRRLREFVGESARSIRRIVINDQYLEPQVLLENPGHDEG